MKYGWYMIQSGNFAERFPDSHLCGNLRGPKRRLRSIETALSAAIRDVDGFCAYLQREQFGA